MFIKKITAAEFKTQQQGKVIQEFASSIGSKITALIRSNLGIPMIQTGMIDSNAVQAKEYIETISPLVRFKLGAQFDESSFIAIGFDSAFISKCSYYWAGGRITPPVLNRGQEPLPSGEQAFLNEVIALTQPIFNDELNRLSKAPIETGMLNDKGIAFKNNESIQINTITCTFKDEEVQFFIIASENILTHCDLEQKSKQADNTLGQIMEVDDLSVDLSVHFTPFEMTLGEINQLVVGQEILITDDSVLVTNKHDNMLICKGTVGYNPTTKKPLIKVL